MLKREARMVGMVSFIVIEMLGVLWIDQVIICPMLSLSGMSARGIGGCIYIGVFREFCRLNPAINVAIVKLLKHAKLPSRRDRQL
jgi:hypothetical protein